MRTRTGMEEAAYAGILARRVRRRRGVLAVGAASVAGAGLLGLWASRQPRRPAAYQPTDTLKPLAEGVHVVDGGPLHGVLPVRMTVLTLPDGGVLLHSPTQWTPGLQAEVDRLGPVRALVAPNTAHWIFLPDWQRAYPDAGTWGAPGLAERKQVKEAGLVIDHTLAGTLPPPWGGELDLVTVPGGFGFVEVALFHRPSRTLLLTDLVLNLETDRLPLPMRPLVRALGAAAPDGRTPAHVRATFRLGGWPARQAARRLVALRPAQVVFAHGRLFEGDPAAELARSLSWLAGKDVA